jgi:hypothetical protein
MTTYAETDRLHKLARPLYLELRALGLDLQAEEDSGTRSGYRIDLVGARSLSPGHVDGLRRRVEEATPGLLRVLWARWDEDLTAIRKEAGS